MRILLLAGLLTLACSLAPATTVLYKDFESLVKEADGIVAGTVTDVQARYGHDRKIYTLVKIQDVQVLAGSYGRGELYVRLLGGEVQGDVLDVQGSPQFAVGDQVVLFLQGNGKQIVPFVGWTQGVFRIQDVAGRQIVTDSDGNRVLGIRGNMIIKETRVASQAEIIGGPQSQAERDPATGSAMSTVRSAPAQGNAGMGEEQTDQVGMETQAQSEAAITRENFVAAIKSKAKARTRAAAAIQSAEVGTFAEDAGPAHAAPPPGSSQLRATPNQETGGAFLPQPPQRPSPATDE
jgi:hypothetical protein